MSSKLVIVLAYQVKAVVLFLCLIFVVKQFFNTVALIFYSSENAEWYRIDRA